MSTKLVLDKVLLNLILRDAYMTAKWLSYKADDPSFSNISAKSWDDKPTCSSRCGWTLSVQATCQFWSGDVLKASSNGVPGFRIIRNWVLDTRQWYNSCSQIRDKHSFPVPKNHRSKE